MGIGEIAYRKVLLLKVRAMTGKEYYLALLYIPKPGWMIRRDMEESMAEIWIDPDLLTAKNVMSWKVAGFKYSRCLRTFAARKKENRNGKSLCFTRPSKA